MSAKFSLKSASEIKKLKKDEAIDYALDLHKHHVEYQSKMEARISDLETGLAASTQVNRDLASLLTKLNARVISLEKDANNNSQYARRRQIELWNIDPSVANAANLKKEAAHLLSLTSVKVEEGDIDVVHKMKKEGRIIIELGRRDLHAKILRARKNLKNRKTELTAKKCPKMSVIESMTFQYKKLEFGCRKLVEAGKLEKSFFFNRKLHIIHNGQHKLVDHVDDLYLLFDEPTINKIYE